MAHNIYIEGFIYGNWGELVSGLNDATDAVLHINSGGGSVTEGFAMADTIRRHAQNKNIELIGTGIVASIATMILLAGSKGNRKMTENSFLMIHNPSVSLDGDSNDLRSMANTLDAMKGRLIETYLNVIAENGKLINNSEDETRAQISAWMDSETWFTARQALDAGLIDAVVPATKYDSSTIRNSIKNYTNIPTEIRNLIEMEITTEEKTLFQKFLNFLGFTPKNEEVQVEPQPEAMEMTEEQKAMELLKSLGYSVEKEIEAAPMAEDMQEEEKEEVVMEAKAEMTNEMQSLKEEIARLKQAQNAIKTTVNVKEEVVEGKTRKERALNRFVNNNKSAVEGIVTAIKKGINS